MTVRFKDVVEVTLVYADGNTETFSNLQNAWLGKSDSFETKGSGKNYSEEDRYTKYDIHWTTPAPAQPRPQPPVAPDNEGAGN